MKRMKKNPVAPVGLKRVKAHKRAYHKDPQKEILRATRRTAKALELTVEEVESIHAKITALPEAQALREAARTWTVETITYPGEQHDNAADLANRDLLTAAVDFTRAIGRLAEGK